MYRRISFLAPLHGRYDLDSVTLGKRCIGASLSCNKLSVDGCCYNRILIAEFEQGLIEHRCADFTPFVVYANPHYLAQFFQIHFFQVQFFQV